MARKKPNILIVIVDSMRADHVSCYGYYRKTTPNIDRLASEGCVFESAITAAPFSPASYASLFSNLYPHQHGVNGDTVRIWPDHFTRLAEKMKENGYSTFGVSNNDFVSQKCNAATGFDQYVDTWQHGWCVRMHHRLLRRVRKYLGNRSARRLEWNWVQCAAKGDSDRVMQTARNLIAGTERPFFGFLVLMDPHAPYNRKRNDFLRDTKAAGRFFREINEGNMWPRLMANHAKLPDEQFQVATDLYDAEILNADRCIGRLCEWLRSQQLLDDTILAISADHGEAFGEHGVWGHGFCLNDSLTRVPLMIRHPDYWNPGTKCTGLVQLHDLHDLCLSVSSNGIPDPERHPHCLTQAQDKTWSGRDVAFSEFPIQTGTLKMFRTINPDFASAQWEQNMWALRTKEWRYIEYGSGQCELYSLSQDPAETTSVHETRPDLCAGFSKRLADHRGQAPYESPSGSTTPGQNVDDKMLDRLRALGYID